MLVLDFHCHMRKQSGEWKKGSQRVVQSLLHLRSGSAVEAFGGSAAR